MKLDTFNEHQIAAYRFHWENSSWATVIVGDPEFMIISDYGTWGHIWNARGKGISMMQFVCQCDEHYLMTKLSDGQREFDHTASMKSLDEDIEEWLENNAGEEINELISEVKTEQMQLRYMSDKSEYEHFLMDSKILSEVYGGDLCLCGDSVEMGFPFDLQGFIKQFWPDIKAKFQEIIAADMDTTTEGKS